MDKCNKCPECGSKEFLNKNLVGPGFRNCKNCGQEWWTDINYWTCTDPDTDQWGRQIDPTEFQFKTKDSIPVTIDLMNYSWTKIHSIMSAYYSGTIEDMKAELGESFVWIAAECIYETEFESRT